MPPPGCRSAGENHDTREPWPMPARLPAHVVGGHHHQIRETSDFGLMAVKAVNGPERHSPVCMGEFA
jgi:hypothetical protein